MTAKQFVELLIRHYEGTGLAPDASISIGHWYELRPELPPEFAADIRVTIDELRKMAQES